MSTNKVVQSMILGMRDSISMRTHCSASAPQNATRVAIRPQLICHITSTSMRDNHLHFCFD